MKLIRIVRTGGLRSNEISQESFEFQEKTKHFVIIRPEERSNKHISKDSIMKPVAEISMASTNLFAMIWCYDYQESEAKELLEEAIKTAVEKEKIFIEKQMSNLEALKERLKTEVRIMY